MTPSEPVGSSAVAGTSGRVIWICGLSGAGKSTLAAEVIRRLAADDEAAIFLDGDELREVFGAAAASGADHSRAARLDLALRYSRLSRLLAHQGFTVVIATISLFSEVHSWNREHLPGYFEVYLDVPIEELRRRDPKGIYRRFTDGEIKNVAGLDVPIDEPVDADLIVEFADTQSVDLIADSLLQALGDKKSDED